MGPAQDNMTDIEREANFNTYIEDFFRPWYRSVEGDKDCTEYQVDGEDPILEVEGIEGHMGKGARLKYLVKWKGHEVKTYERWQHLHKYGAKEVIEQYRMKNKMRTSKKANLANTEGKIYYCNLSERYIREYNQEEAVKELISKQNKKGTVGDWLKPYREEYDQISKKRLTRLTKEELTREVMRTAIPMRMLLDTKRDGRLKARLVALGYREPKEWDTISNSSPVADLSSIRTLIYKAGDPNDVLSSIDVSVAFLQANPYHEDDVKRYVSYKP